MNMTIMQINACHVRADMIFDNHAHRAHSIAHRRVKLPEIPQAQDEVDDATDDAPAFINSRMATGTPLTSTHTLCLTHSWIF